MQNRLCGVLTCWIVLASFAMRCGAEGLTSEVRQFKGIPALYVNGVLTSQSLAAPYRDPQRSGLADFNDFRRAGISIFDIYVRFPWTAPETYDFAPVDRKLDAYLAVDAKVLFLPRILLTPGRWFRDSFPTKFRCATMARQPGCFPARTQAIIRRFPPKNIASFRTRR